MKIQSATKTHIYIDDSLIPKNNIRVDFNPVTLTRASLINTSETIWNNVDVTTIINEDDKGGTAFGSMAEFKVYLIAHLTSDSI